MPENKERKIRLRSRGQIQELGPSMLVRGALPNPDFEYVSPFILLHHIQPTVVESGWDHIGVPSHPHKGFITLTYMLDGEFRHRDSSGGSGLIRCGGAQWMMTGSGIVHEEMIGEEFAAKGGRMEMLQLWINLPSEFKKHAPYYRIMEELELPVIPLGESGGRIRVLAGSYEGSSSPLKTETPLGIFRVTLHPGGKASLEGIPQSFNLMGYLTSGALAFGPEKTIVDDGETILFSNSGDWITLENPGQEPADLFLFGGEPILEPVVASGPFVMNTREEIQEAYRQFREGQFGLLHPAQKAPQS